MKKYIGILLAFVMVINPASIVHANEQADNQSGNSEGVVYASGYIPGELDSGAPAYEREYAIYSEVPSRFPDSVDVIRDTYPDSRNQNPYGTCWSFSSIGLAEFDLINDGAADRNIDLSELQLVHFLFNSVNDPLGGTEGDSAKYYNENAQNNYLNYGGNYEMASRRLAQWVGVVPETDVPYSSAADVLDNGVNAEYAYTHDVAHLQNVYRINIKQNASDVKQMIMEHGAVGVMYQHLDSGLMWNDSRLEHTYYDTSAMGSGHAVMIVGWDDNYSKENFIGTQPSGDGAWLVRNSWGIYANYIWMSYETFSLSDTAWVFDFSANDGFDNNYQLDGGLETSTTSYTTMANVFTVKNSADVKSETLKAVSLSVSRAANVNYTIEVYTELTDEKNPLSGTKQESATTQGTTAYAGVYTIELNDEVKLVPGSKFAVIVSVDQNALDCEQATVIADGEGFSNVIWECKVSQYNQKTFYKSGGRFYVFPWGNLCVKAFTTDNASDEPEKAVYSIAYNLDGGVNDASNPDRYTEGNSAIELKEASREGYTFEGWYTDAGFNNRITEIPSSSTGNYTLYAKWKQMEVVKKEYTISYNLDGGVNDASNPDRYTEGNSAIELKDASREGYIFEGWYTDAGFNNRITEIASSSTGNYTLYAKWKQIEEDSKPSEDSKPVDAITAYVGKLYENVLGRKAGTEEVNGWVNSIKAGQCSVKETVYGFVFSKEYLDKNTTDEQYVDMLYNSVLGRKPDAAGKAGMIQGLSNGYSRKYILSVFVDSPEFTSLCNRMNVESGNGGVDNKGDNNSTPNPDNKPNTGSGSQDAIGNREEGVAKFVSRCYEKILSRKYDIDGFNGWCNALLNNVLTPEQVVIEGFFGSQELHDKNIDDEEYIRILYRAFLDREADKKEVTDWIESKQRQNLSRDRIIHEFANSPEFLNLMSRYGL